VCYIQDVSDTQPSGHRLSCILGSIRKRSQDGDSTTTLLLQSCIPMNWPETSVDYRGWGNRTGVRLEDATWAENLHG
jgi:hypothetical protein